MSLTTSASGSLPQERFGVRAVGMTDVGRQRDVNEDAFWVDEQQGVFVVCDGMGGHASGQVASDLAVRTIPHSPRFSDVAATRTRAEPSLGVGSSTSRSSTMPSPSPGAATSARISRRPGAPWRTLA